MTGLLPRTVLLVLLTFTAAAAAAVGFFAPALARAAERQALEVSSEAISRARDIIEARSLHSTGRMQRELLDLPFELVAGDPARTRALVDSSVRESGFSAAHNVGVLTREFESRMAVMTARRAAVLAADFRHQALLALLAVFGATLLLSGFALFHTVIAPVGRLLSATERVANGDLSVTVGMTRHDEIGRLGRAFDRMTGHLGASRREIEELNGTLAGRVREKTEELTRRNEELTRTVTELEATRDALVHAQTMASIGTLAGGVAHEFNNLLGGIIGCAETARHETDPAAVPEALDMILRTARRACHITENLLNFSRPPAREVKDTDLSELAREALSLVAPEARAKGILLAEDAGPPVRIPVDPGQVHQVVLNLLTNAIRATPRGGSITLSARRDGGDGVIRVADTGSGIEPSHLPLLFQPFFTTRREGGGKGSGLGLSVSWSIVKAHGGRIDVESRPGEGAVFTVRIPVPKEDA